MLALAQLLFSVAFGEMSLILLLLFKTPLRKLLIVSLDRAKRGRGPIVVKSVGGTVLLLFIYTVYSIQDIQSRPLESINPTDQVLLAYLILEASLLGFVLFLALMIDRLHHYIRELRVLRKAMETVKKQDQSLDNGKSGDGEKKVKSLKDEISSLTSKISLLESQLKDVRAQEAKSESLKVKYEQLLQENQNLQSQLNAIKRGGE